MQMIEDLYDLCETLEKDLAKTNEKLRMAGGEMSGADLEYVDKLTHSLKSIKTTIAMIEADEDGGYSGYGYRMWPMSYEGGQGGSSNARGNRGGNSNRGGSYARGRRNARRDSMGRYSGEGGYSRDGDFREMLEEAMDNAPNEQVRTKLQRIMSEM